MSSSRSRAKRWISSTPRRDLRKQIVRTSRATRSASSLAASLRADARLPSFSSTSGGFHITTWRSAWGAPSRSTSSISRPVSPSPSWSGLAIVALVSTKRGLRAVGAGEPPQPAQHVGHVRAEHPAVDVRLVDHHPGEVGEHVAPVAVVGQHAHVQHVRVGQDQVGALADRPALLARRVAVVDRVAQERCHRALTACAPGPGRAPWSGRGRTRAPRGRRRACRARAG